MKLSLVVNTKNSAKTLASTLKSAKAIVDEIVVVDMKSSDETVKIAKNYGARVYEFEDIGYVEPARNFALSKAKAEWILLLDSDEELSDKLKIKIKSIINSSAARVADCYYLPRKNLIFNEFIRHTGWWPDYQLRLFKNGYVKWLDEIHSFPLTHGEVVQLPAQEELAIIHHEYQSISQFIDRLNRYTSIKTNNSKKQKITSVNILNNFTGEFLSRLFDRQGIEDGIHGLSLSLLQAMYEAVVQMKQWEMTGFQENNNSKNLVVELKKFQRDLNYWLADYQVNHSSDLFKIYWRLRRKFKI